MIPFDMTFWLAIGAAIFTSLTVLMVIIVIRTWFGEQAQVTSRLNTYLGDDALGKGFDNSDEAQRPLIDRFNEAVNQQGFAERVARDLQRADLRLTVSEYLMLRIGLPLALIGLGLLFWRVLLVVPIAMLIGIVLPILWMQSRRSQRNQRFAEQLPDTIQLIANSMRSGFSLPQALRQTARESNDPTRAEFERLLQEIALGVDPNEALDHLVDRMESADLDLVVTAIKINARVGGNLSTILENVTTTIRERQKLRREVRVITSMQRISSYVVGSLPIALAGIIFVINPSYMSRLFDPRIICVPILALVLTVIGFIIVRRISNIRI
jgi:tight adherence protein B